MTLSESTNSASSASSTATQVIQSNAGEKRLHSEEPVTASGRAKQQKPDPLATQGRYIGRTMDAFLTPGAMFNHGIRCAALDSDDEELGKQTPEQQRYLKIFSHLCRTIPNFQDSIVNADAARFRAMGKAANGLSSARSDDIACLKGVVVDWVSAPPYHASNTNHLLQRNSKATRGFNNPVIGKLLCPTDFDWDDQAIQQGLRDETIAIDPSQWPNFVYQDGQPPAEDVDIWTGLFRHPLIVKTLKHIYTSPSSVDGIDRSRATRANKASLCNMTGVTPGAVADAIVKLRHSLSSKTTFHKNDKTTHNQPFYYGLLEILEADQAKSELEELFLWYNKQLFPGQDATSNPAANSALAKMRVRLGVN